MCGKGHNTNNNKSILEIKDKLIKDAESYNIKISRNKQLHCGKTS